MRGSRQSGGRGTAPSRDSREPQANKALLPSAWALVAADSLRSLAAIMIGRRSRAPRR